MQHTPDLSSAPAPDSASKETYLQAADIQGSLLDALPENVALIDSDGVIVALNESWRRFAIASALQGPGFGLGENYLDICERACENAADEAHAAAIGIRHVLRGEASDFTIEYASHSPTEQRWFRLRVTPVRDVRGTRAVVMHVDITERKLAEHEARQLSQQLTTTLESLTDGFFTLDREWRFTYLNSEAERLFTVPRAELLGHNIWEKFPEAVGTISQIAYERAVRDNVPEQFETFYEPLNTWFDARAFPSALGLAVYFRDITAVRHAAVALRTSEERFRLLAGATNDAIWDWDLASGTLWWNEGFETLFGHRREDVSGSVTSWTDYIHPDDLTRVTTGIHTAIDGEDEVWTDEYRFRCRDGSYAHVLDRGHFIRDAAGKAVRMVGGMSDVSDRRRAAEALRTSLDEFRTLAEAMPHIVWITQPDGANIYVNQNWMDYTGLTLQEGLGVGWNAAFHPDDQERSWFAWHRTIEAGGVFSLESRMRRADGAYRWWLIRGVPLRNTAGAIVKWVGTCTDIHDLKLAELEISRTNRALQSEIVERTRAEDAADKANRAKGEFLANMSHEIRTPLNGVIGMTELALATDLTIEQREYLNMVKSSGESLLAVIKDILDFSKIEAGMLAIDAVPFDLNDCLAATLRLMATRAHLRGLELACDVRAGVPTALVGDSDRLRQIVTNLVGNAIKFTERGDVMLTVDVQIATERTAVLRFSVSDTGIGIAAEKQDTIFQPFTQADGSTTRKYGGTGLGLAISTKLVALLGGRIWLESTIGKGSTFHFSMPFDVQSAVVDTTADPRLARLTDVPILVVDDNANNRRILGAMLSGWHMMPVLVEHGQSGLAAMQERLGVGRAFPFVVVAADLPDLDGFSIAESIKKDPALAGATILMLTSTGRGDEARCRELGIAACLMKPINRAELLNVILTVAGGPADDTAQPQVVQHAWRDGERRLRILLAEDNKVNQLVAARLLGKRGHTVVIAETGHEALAVLDAADAGVFDLILMDIQMPDMDGFAATAVIRAREEASGAHLPIIAMTAHAMKGDEERCLAAGMDGYVAKPFQIGDVLAIIDRVLA